MGTLSVSVSDELKERIIQTEEVNWSAIARRAFEEKLKEIEELISGMWNDESVFAGEIREILNK